jgi:hypothetical protein
MKTDRQRLLKTDRFTKAATTLFVARSSSRDDPEVIFSVLREDSPGANGGSGQHNLSILTTETRNQGPKEWQKVRIGGVIGIIRKRPIHDHSSFNLMMPSSFIIQFDDS